MAKTTLANGATKPQFVVKLSAALRKGLPGARVRSEQVRRNRYRFIVVWDKFDRMGHPERQRKVWSIADATLGGAGLLDISMILTLGRKDALVS